MNASTMERKAIHPVLSRGAVGEDVVDKKMPGWVSGELPWDETAAGKNRAGRCQYTADIRFLACCESSASDD